MVCVNLTDINFRKRYNARASKPVLVKLGIQSYILMISPLFSLIVLIYQPLLICQAITGDDLLYVVDIYLKYIAN
jgi:hypothetical protein